MPKKNPNKKTQEQYNRANPYMNEMWGKRPYMKWFKAVVIYNLTDDDPRFNIPRIGTREHEEVRKIQHTNRKIRLMEEPARTALPSAETKQQHKDIRILKARNR